MHVYCMSLSVRGPLEQQHFLGFPSDAVIKALNVFKCPWKRIRMIITELIINSTEIGLIELTSSQSSDVRAIRVRCIKPSYIDVAMLRSPAIYMQYAPKLNFIFNQNLINYHVSNI